jgi:hypothetical protein
MSSHFLRPVGDSNQELPKGIEQPPFDLFKYPLSAAASCMRVDDDKCLQTILPG